MIGVRRPLLCLVTDRRALAPAARTRTDELVALERQLDDAIAAGLSLIQIRERDLPARVLSEVAARVAARCRGTHTRLVINDRLDVAMSVTGAGVHLRSDGPPAETVRPLAGNRRIVGCSTHDPVAPDRVRGADYLFFGTVFESASKPPGSPVAGLEALARACEGTSIPVLAIGGITPERVSGCRRAGAEGVAAIRLFIPDVRRAVAAIIEAWEKTPPPG